MYTIILGLITGSVAAAAMGDSPSWLRVFFASLTGLIIGSLIDIGLTVLAGPEIARMAVVMPIFPPYGFTESALIAIPFSLIGATLAARRNWNRIKSPNDLRY